MSLFLPQRGRTRLKYHYILGLKGADHNRNGCNRSSSVLEQGRAAMTGKTIVITGVTRGLGRAMAEGFAAAGHTVVGCGRDQGAIADLQPQYPAPHHFIALDVTDEFQVQTWAKTVLETVGTPDYLINNAAMINAPAPLWEIPAAEFNQLIDINIKGVATVLRHFLPPMIARQQGVIVNFSSGWGRSTSPEVAPYCASKWAMEGLTRSLAQELPDGMAAIPLNPGVIDTDMLRTCFGHGAGGYPTAADWGKRAVPFLLSLQPHHNGQPLTVPM